MKNKYQKAYLDIDIVLLIVIILTLLTTPLYAQVGINTEEPEAMLDVNGNVRIQDMNTLTEATYVLVEGDNQIVSKIAIADLAPMLNRCPHLSRSTSSGYHLKFYSNSSIPNPNNSLVIQGINFVSAGTWIEDNTYYFTYSNTSGQPLNINNFTVNFSGINCVYN